MTLGEDVYRTINWSLGGFLLGNYQGPHLPGETVEGTFRIEAQEPEFAFVAEVVRTDYEAATMAAQFQELAPGAIDYLDKALARRIIRRV